MRIWINPIDKLPEHKQLVICNIGCGKPNPMHTKVAEYDALHNCFVFGEADGNLQGYAYCGFVKTGLVTGWIPFPEI